MNYEILCTRGTMQGRRWELTPKGVKIGRADSCEVLVADVAAELFHCIVKLVDGRPVVLNLASDHGVVVNGANVDEAQLKPNDEISVGGECFAIAAIGVEKRGRGAQIAAPVVALVLALAAVAFVLWRKGQAKREVAPPPVATNAVAQVEAPVTTNRVVRVVTEERVVTNRIVRIVDNVMVTNYVVETRRVDEKTGEEIVESDNPYVPPEPTDGLVLSEDGKTLVFVPQGIAHVVIPNGVTAIGDRAFADHKALESVTIPPSVTKFGRDAFRGCNRLVGVFITDLAAWCQISFEWDNKNWNCANDNPLCYAHNLYLNGSLVRHLEIPQGVRSVGNNAFRGCSSLTSVTIPDCVRSIGPGAFAASTLELDGNLVKIEVDADNRYYKSVNGLLLTKDGRTLVAVPVGLESVTIPAGVVSIGDRAFAVCTKLSKLTIPGGVTSIRYRAFVGCHNLRSISIPPSMEKIEFGAFWDCNNLADVYITDLAAWCRMSVDEVAAHWNHARKLHLNGEMVKDLSIPKDVTDVRGHVFRGCASLTSVTIPRSVERVGWGSFAKCFSLAEFKVDNGNRNYKDVDGLLLTKDGKTLVAVPGAMECVKIPNGVEVIGSMAFCGCNKISNLKIPSSVTKIGYKAFSDCYGLVSVEIPDSVKSFAGYGAFAGCSKLSTIVIPGSVESIPGTFSSCGGLTNAAIQTGVKNICGRAFAGTKLKSIVIPDSVTNIAAWAFVDCKQLESVTIPEGLTNIHERAFADCPKLLDANGRPRLTRVPSTAEKTKPSRSAK